MNRVEFIKELSNHLAYEVRPSEEPLSKNWAILSN